MQIDIGAVIATLLYENDTVSVPGLGAFMKSISNAEHDHELGNARPERSKIEFDPDMPIDDGLLIAYIKDTYHLSYLEAKQTVSRYVEEVNAAIARKETVVFPDVGRLYMDYNQELHFIPDGTNFNLDTFGLPEISIQPVTSRTTESIAVDPAIVAEPRGKWVRQNWPVLAILVVLLGVLLGFRFIYPKLIKSQQKDPTADLPSSRLNVKPPLEEDQTATLSDSTIAGENDTEAEEPDYDDQPTTENPVVDEGPICIIAIGIFREKANVDKLAQQLMDAGYEPYIEKLRSSTRVGVQFKYESSTEIDTKLQDIRQKFVKEAFILRK